jgi:DNA-binding GntR family transcriptional regulator
MGLIVTNKLIDKKTTSGRIRWITGLGTTQWDETVWLRRIKLAADELLAVEERLLPGFLAKRFSQSEIENGIIIDLVEHYPDTQITRFNYIFHSHPLTKEEARTLKLPQGMNYMRRIGEYYNSINERFMLSRLTIISDRINLGYHCLKQDENWVSQQ